MSAQAKQFSILALPGDGIGPEVTTEALKVLDVVARSSGLKIDVRTEKLFGGSSIDAIGKPISEELVEAAKQADAVLMGAVGGPKWYVSSTLPAKGFSSCYHLELEST
jgi:3-isopropylmalate dehydrogenase